MSTACDKCNGKGSIVHFTYDGDSISSYITALCACRSSLPPRHGKAAWWTHGASRSEEMTTRDGLTRFGVRWTPELPVSADNYPLLRTRDNSYWTGKVEIAIDDGSTTSDGLREIAAFLTRMADQIDRWDAPVPDEPTHTEAPQ